MAIEPVSDYGQQLPPPSGKVIGFLDTKNDFEAFTQSLQRAGFPPSKIISIAGEDGIQLLERLKHGHFFFGDSEDNIIQASINELKKGGFAVAIAIDSRADARRISDIAATHGGHGFGYFGFWVNERLS